MNFKHQSWKVLITGASGMGKTRYFLSLIERTPAALKFVFDHQGEFAVRARVRSARTLKEFVGPVICFDPAQMFPGRTEEAFRFFCDFAFTVARHTRGRKLFCCDELQKLIGTSNHEMPQELRTLLETGRREELDFVAIAQSPNTIHTRVRNQMTEIVCFRQADERATRFVEQLGIVDARKLAPGEYRRLEVNTGALYRGRVNLATGKTTEEKCSDSVTAKTAS